jgi:heat-inducible transcriptional repressor
VQNVAVVTLPKPASCRFQHLELVSLKDTLALLVLVLHGATLRQQLITFDQAVSQEELSAMANKLNEACADKTSARIADSKIKLTAAEQQVADCLLKIMEDEDEQEYEHTSLDGLHFTLNQPEFRRGEGGQVLIELVDGRNLMQTITPTNLAAREVRVIIGQENRAKNIRECSVVINKYGLPEEAEGIIGVVGPTRMPYARTISAVHYISSVLGRLVAELYGRKPEEN